MSDSNLVQTSILTLFSTTYGVESGVDEFVMAESRQLLREILRQLDHDRFSYPHPLQHLIRASAKKLQVTAAAKQLIERFLSEFQLSQTELLLTSYLLALKDDNCSQSTIKNYRSDIRQFFTFTQENEVLRVFTKPKVAQFLRNEKAKGLTKSSIRRKVVSISQFAIWLELSGVIRPRSQQWLVELSQHFDELYLQQLSDKTKKPDIIPVAAFAPEVKNTNTTQSQSIKILNKPDKNNFWSRLLNQSKRNSNSTQAQVPPKLPKGTSPLKAQDRRYELKQRLYQLQSRLTSRSRTYVVPYLNLLLSLILFLGMGYFGYLQLFGETEQPLAFPSTLTRPNRTLSFQGRLTDTEQNPILTTTDMRFRLYDSGPSIVGGNLLWDSAACSVTPDQDGIFAVGLGDDCGGEISSDVFSENANVWLQVEVEAEVLSPRQSIKSVAYALNSETLQGYPASPSAVENTVVIMDNNGEIVLGNANPVLKATGDSFAIEAETLTLRTSSGSNGNIVLDPDGTGRINLLANVDVNGYIKAPGATLSATYAGGTALTLNAGPSATADIMRWQNSAGSNLGVIDESGNVGIGSVNPAFNLDVSGTGRFTGNLQVDTLAAGSTDTVITHSSGVLQQRTIDSRVWGSSSLVDGSGSANAVARWTDANTLGTGVLTDDGTNVGISDATPTYKLDVNGTGRFVGALELDSTLLDVNNSAGSSGQILSSTATGIDWIDLPAATANYWKLSNGAISPFSDSLDLLVGSSSSASAKFAVLNVNSGTPAASVSSGLSGNSMFMTADGSLSTTRRSNLTIGNSSTYNTTGNVLINSNGVGRVGIGNATPDGYLTVGNDPDPADAHGDLNIWTTSDLTEDTGGTGQISGLWIVRYGDPSTTFTGTLEAIDATAAVKLGNAEDFNNLKGVAGAVVHGGSGTITSADGTAGWIINASTGTISSGRAFTAYNPLNTGGGTFTNNYGLYVENMTGGTNDYGVYIAGADTYALWADAGDVRIDGRAGVWASPTATTLLNVGGNANAFSGSGGIAFGVYNDMVVSSSVTTATVGVLSQINTQAASFTLADAIAIEADSPELGAGSAITRSYGLFVNTQDVTGVGTGYGIYQVGAADINYLAGNVGVGTTSPDFPLQVNGIIAPETTDQDLGTSSLRWDVFANTINADSTVTLTSLTASRAVFTDGSSNLVSTGASAALLNSLSDETGTGVAVFGTSPEITTSLTTGSTNFDLLNTTATTINFAGAASTLNIGPGSTTATSVNLAGGSGATGCTVDGATGNFTCTGAISGSNSVWQYLNGAISPVTPYTNNADLLVGSNATEGAKFAVLNVLSGTPTASVSSGVSGNSMFMTADGSLSTTRRNNLTIGNSSTYNTTGNVLINPNGAGSVGIGTTAPVYKLDVVGTGANGTYAIRIKNTSNGVGQTADFRAENDLNQYASFSKLGSAFGSYKIFTNTDFAIFNSSGGDISFLNDNASGEILFAAGGNSTAHLAISSAGNVGIGSTSPGRLLDVGGAGRFAGALELDSTLVDINDSAGTSGQVLTSTSTGVDWVDSSTVGTDDQTLAEVLVAGNSAGSTNIDMNNQLILNIGNAGTDFTSGGGLTLAGTLDSNGDLSIADTDIAFDGASTTFTTTGAFTLTPGGAVVLGDGGDTLSINTSDWDISTAGAMTGISGITNDSTFTTSGGAVSINASSNFATNINTGTSNGALSLGGGSGTVAVNSTSWDISTAGVGSGFTGLTSSGTITFSGLTANRLVTTTTGGELTTSISSANAASSFSDETGTGLIVYNTSPEINTSLVTGSSSFDLLNTTATTINFGGAASTLNIGPGSSTATSINFAGGSGATGCTVDGATGNFSCTGTISGSNSVWQYVNGAISPITPYTNNADLLVGSNATAGAKFAILNVLSGTPTASISSGVSGNGMYMTADGSLSTTKRTNLTIGNSSTYNTTGAVLINSNGTGNVGIGTTTTGARISVLGASNTANVAEFIGDRAGSNINAYFRHNSAADVANSARLTFQLNTTVQSRTAFEFISGFSDITDATRTSYTYFAGTDAGSYGNRMALVGSDFGVGTITPTARLDINGTASTSATLSFRGTTDPMINILNNENFSIQTSPGGNAGLVERVTLLNNGNLGIGTTAPLARLDVRGNIFSLGTDPAIVIGDAASAGNYSYLTWVTASDILLLGTDTGGANLSLNESGNVGVGTTSPSSFRLQVAGHAGPQTNDTYDLGSDTLRWRDLYLGGETLHIGASTTDEGTISYTSGNILSFGTDSTTNGDIAFFTDDLYLDKSSGNIGIGTTTPDFALQVAGDIAPEVTDSDLGSSALRWDLFANTINADSTVTLTSLTASRAVFTDGSSNLVSTAASAALLNSLSDETGTGVAVFGTSPEITTSLTTGSTSFDLLNSTATTINFAGAASTLNIGPGSNTATAINFAGGNGDTGCTIDGANGNFTCSGTINGANSIWQYLNGAISAVTPYTDNADLLVGADATAGAKFAVLNVFPGSGTPTASVSSGISGNGMYMTADGSLATTRRTNLTIGNSSTYNTTGSVLINSNGTGNVGIGTTTTTSKLDIASGSIEIDNGFSLAARRNTGSALINILGITTGTDTLTMGLPNSNVGSLALNIINTGATSLMAITGDGNVGIGTTTPDFSLQVNGVIAPETTDQDLGATSLRWDLFANTINADSTVTLTGLGTGTDNTVLILDSSNNVTTDEIDARVWGTSLIDGAGAANRVAYWSDADTLTSDDDFFFNGSSVGIGTTTPGFKLDVYADTGSSAVGGLRVTSTDQVSGAFPVMITTDTTGMTFGTSAGNTLGRMLRFNDTRTGAGIYDMGIDANGYFYITQKTSTTAAITMNNVGNLGIGTATVNAKLHVFGSSELLRLDDSSATGGPFMSFYQAGTRRSYIEHQDSNDTLNITSEYGALALRAASSAGTDTDTQYMRIIAGGNIGMGTNFSSPTARLHVYGTSGEASANLRVESDNGGATPSIIVENNDASNQVFMRAYGSGFGGSTYGFTNTDLTTILSNNYLAFGTTTATDLGFITNNTRRMTLDSTGNLGIGTTTIRAKLDIEGSASSSGTLAFRGTTDPKIDILNNENFGIRTSVGGDVGLTERLTVIGNGNIGIGTTTPASKLDIDTGSNAFGLRLRGAAETVELADIFVAANGNLVMDTTVGTGTASFIDLRPEDDQYGLILRESDGTGTNIYANFYLTDAATDYLTIGVNTATDADALVVAASNNIGIGVLDPDKKLEVNVTGSTDGIKIDGTTNPALSLWTSGTLRGYLAVATSGGAYITGSTANDIVIRSEADDIHFGNSGAQTMTLTSGNNVGIGTITANAKTHIFGSGELLRLDDTSATGNPFMSFHQAGTRRSYIQHNDTSDTLRFASEYGALSFLAAATAGTDSETEYLRIIAGGSVGIGTSSPLEKVHIKGTGATNVIIDNDSTASQVALEMDQNGTARWLMVVPASSTDLRFSDTADTIMTLTAANNVGIGTTTVSRRLHVYQNSDAPPVRFEDTSGYCEINPISTAWTCTSDERLKKDISSLSNSKNLSRLLDLRAVSFLWKNQTTSEQRTGFIAQEVEQVFPEYVRTDEQGLKSVSYGSFTPIIISAMQAQQDQIKALQSGNVSKITFTSEGELSINGNTGTYTVTASGNTLTTIIGASKAVIGKITAGLVNTRELLVTQSATIASLSVTNLTITGQNIGDYIRGIVQQELQTNPLPPGAVAEDFTTDSLTVNKNATVSGSLAAATITTNTLSATTSALGSLLAETATISGDLVVQQNASIAGTLIAENITAESSRFQTLESRMAELENIKAQTAQLVDATVSGTLYADNIYNFDEKLAESFKKPTLLELLTQPNENPVEAASPASIYEPIEMAGYASTNPDLIATNSAILALDESDVVLGASALFVEKYLEVNGHAYVAQSLGIGNTLKIGNSLTISNGSIDYQPAGVDSPVLAIQSSGRGKLDLLAGVMTIEAGQVKVTGNFTVAGSIKADTLLTNLAQPADFGNPFQVQVAGISTESGELKKTRFEIINETGQAVASFDADGNASFQGGVSVGNQNLTSEDVSDDTVSTDKSSGKAKLTSGKAELKIQTPKATPDSLIYVTPKGSTENKVLYIKAQGQGEFTVGFDAGIGQDVEFNWWIVN